MADEAWKRVDLLFEQLSTTVEPNVVVVLTEEPAEKAGTLFYVFFEPFAYVVIALSHAEKKVSISTDHVSWRSFEPGFTSLIEQAGRLLQQGQTMEAVLLSMQKLGEVLNGPQTLPASSTGR